MRLGALVACAELLGSVTGAPEAAASRRHLASAEAASLVGYASSVFLQARQTLLQGRFASVLQALNTWGASLIYPESRSSVFGVQPMTHSTSVFAEPL